MICSTSEVGAETDPNLGPVGQTRIEAREIFAAKMFQRLFSLPLAGIPEELKTMRLNSGSFRVCDLNRDHFMDEAEARSCSDSYFQGIGRDPVPLYFNPQNGKLIGDNDPVDQKLNRREWEKIHHQLSYGIAVSMISLIKGKELPEMEPLDYVIRNDEKIFLEEQLKYYFQFSDNRWSLNVAESKLEDKAEWTVIDVSILLGRLYNDFIRKFGAKQ